MNNTVNYRPEFRWEGPPVLELQRGRMTNTSGLTYMSHRLVVQDGAPGVVVVAMDHGHILLVLSERPAAEETMWELPRGFGEGTDGDANDPAAMIAGAERELLEETGLKSLGSTLLGTYITDSSIYPSKIGVVRCDVDPSAPAGDWDGEIDAMRWVKLEALPELISNGTIHDAHSLAALACWKFQQG